MVNCKKCGAPLSLDNAYCPHCGTANPEAQEHLKKLKVLDAQVESAKQEVTAEVQKSKKGYGVLIILAMLLLANLVALVLHGASYEIAEKIIASRRSETEIKATMDNLLDEGEYIEFELFANKYSLSYKDYREYLGIEYLARDYEKAVEDMTRYLYAIDNYDDPLIKVCEDVVDFKAEYQSLLRRDMEEKTALHIERLNGEMDAFLKAYLNLDEEDIKGLDSMNSSALLILVNERLSGK